MYISLSSTIAGKEAVWFDGIMLEKLVDDSFVLKMENGDFNADWGTGKKPPHWSVGTAERIDDENGGSAIAVKRTGSGYNVKSDKFAVLPGKAYTVTIDIKQTIEMREDIGREIPMGTHLYNWHQIPFDTNYPHYNPARKDSERSIPVLQAHDIKVMPYINGRLWDTHDRGDYDYQFTKLAKPHCVKNYGGEPTNEHYGARMSNGEYVKNAVILTVVYYSAETRSRVLVKATMWIKRKCIKLGLPWRSSG